MRNFLNRIVVIFIIVSIFSCTNSQKTEQKDTTKVVLDKNGKKIPNPNAPIMDFLKGNIVDLGKINQGEIRTHTFKFKNTGKSPLKIEYANASCGCTVPSWPHEPIAPGGTGDITVEFNSKNKEGKLFKNVSIYANTVPEFNTVAFNVEVLVPEKK
jgi:hypothetical protein